MSSQFEACLRRFDLPEFNADWGRMQRGIEKESLRVSPQGHIALSSHPPVLGSALTNPYITTDFSEALLEFITPVYRDIDACLGMLEAIHRFTCHHLENRERLWTSSMPCSMVDSEEIPLAQYGSSNIGRLKTLYREGLSHRYGSIMQTVAGIHYNFSMPDSFWPAYRDICRSSAPLQQFTTDKYLHLIRNFHRYSWLLLYLFGASPAVCKCFVRGRKHNLQVYDEDSFFRPDATCLRMGGLGYSSEAQQSLFVCYNDLDTYVKCLHRAMHTPYPAYEAIGLKKNGKYLQINANLLQLENEFYSTIRPKRISKTGDRPLTALINEGIEYVEVRALDLNPFLPLGIDAEQIRFLDAFLLYCLLTDSPQCNEGEFFEVAKNIAAVVDRGRDPQLLLSLQGEDRGLTQWATELVNDINHSAVLLDQVHGQNKYTTSVAAQLAKVADPALTPSGQILKTMQDRQISFYRFAMEQAATHRDFFLDSALDEKTRSHMEATSTESRRHQQAIEAADDISFDEFLRQWNST